MNEYVSIRNQRGEVTVVLLATLPLVLAVLATALAGALLFAVDGELRHACRLELLAVQSSIGHDLEALLSLNSEAAQLRLERRDAEVNLEASVGTPAQAAAALELAWVTAAQGVLSAKQNQLIARARLKSRTAPTRAIQQVRSKIETHLKNFVVETTQFGVPSKAATLTLDLRTGSQFGSFELIASPLDSPTPDYSPAPGFQHSQLTRVTWSFALSSLLPKWLRPLAEVGNLRLRGECSASLYKRANDGEHETQGESRWIAKLSADRR